MKDTEYTSLRSQISHQDDACLTMVGILLGTSTAIYGLAIEKSVYSLLPILSILWVVGFLYICEKRFWIRRTARYLRENIEDKDSGLYWQSWLRENQDDERFLRFSPLKLEYVLLLVVATTNVFLLFIPIEIALKYQREYLYMSISIIMLIVSILIGFRVVRFYYKTARDS